MMVKVTFKSYDSPATPDDIEIFENKWKVHFPDSFRYFLMHHNSGIPVPRFLPVKNPPFGFEYIEVSSFNGLGAKLKEYDMDLIMEMLKNNIPHGILPIADIPWDGRRLVFDLRDGSEEVKFWDSAKFWGNNVWKEDYLYPVAKDFATLLTMFVTEDEAMDQSMRPLSEFLD